MNETFLSYIWQHKLFNQQEFFCSSGEKVEVINPGELNHDAGPDFFNAKIKIGNTLWAGNVEIHVNASDWYAHKHDKDKLYENIILHVVVNNDKPVYHKNGEMIPCIELNFYPSVYENYIKLLKPKNVIKCAGYLNKIDPFHIQIWLEQLAIERLSDKVSHIQNVLKKNKNNWEETFYQLIAYSFGLKINHYPFEQLAISLPNKILAKHKNQLFQIEALLFGQAGFLNNDDGDEYYSNLRKEYGYLKQKYSLETMDNKLWKFMRLRPANFPTVRIAQFAWLIYQSNNLFSRILATSSFDQLKKLFNIQTSAYWDTHYVFSKTSKMARKKTGQLFFNNLMINTVAPILFLYGKSRDDEGIAKRAIEILENIPPENNTIIVKWKNLNIDALSAFHTQALIQLYNKYCKNSNCLKCQIGHRVLTRKLPQ